MAVLGQPKKKFSKIPISTKKLPVLLHVFYPSYLEGIDKRIMVSRQAWEKHKTLPEN
jgi:hypothetical protein